MIAMSGKGFDQFGFEDRLCVLEMEIPMIKSVALGVDSKVEEVRRDIHKAQMANTRMIQAMRDDMTEFRDSVSVRFDTLETRMESGFASMNSRFVAMEASTNSRFEAMDSRFDEVIALIKEIKSERV